MAPSALPASRVTPRVVSCPALAGAGLWLAGVEDASASAARHTAWLWLQCQPWCGMQAVCIPALGTCSHHLILSALVLQGCMVGHLARETEVSNSGVLQGFALRQDSSSCSRCIQHNQSVGLVGLMPKKLPDLRWTGNPDCQRLLGPGAALCAVPS